MACDAGVDLLLRSASLRRRPSCRARPSGPRARARETRGRPAHRRASSEDADRDGSRAPRANPRRAAPTEARAKGPGPQCSRSRVRIADTLEPSGGWVFSATIRPESPSLPPANEPLAVQAWLKGGESARHHSELISRAPQPVCPAEDQLPRSCAAVQCFTNATTWLDECKNACPFCALLVTGVAHSAA
jgi:hypothetical protein